MSTRRQFIIQSGAAAALTALPAAAIEPISRINPRIKGVSLSAYSMRSEMQWMKGKKQKGSLGMMGFLDYCAEVGVAGAELTAYFFPEPLQRSYINQVKRHAHVLGLDITGGAIGNNFSFTPGTPQADAQAAYTKTWIDHYANLGAPVIRVFAGRSGPRGATDEQILSNIHANLNEALKHADSRGVILAMENHDSMTNMDRLLGVVKTVDSKWFGVTWDTGNLDKVADPYAELARIAPYALNAQIKVKIPVNGKKEEADLAKLVDILKAAKFSGYLVLEYEEGAPREHIPQYVKKLTALI
jgi:sugar phosphate isomerase/epimerase